MKFRLPNFFPRETLLMALDSVRGHKFRSALTVLGIVIGVIVSIVVASILTGLRANIVHMVEEYGTNNIYAFHQTTVFGENEEDNAVFVPFRTGIQVAPGRKFLIIVMRAKSGQLPEALNQV